MRKEVQEVHTFYDYATLRKNLVDMQPLLHSLKKVNKLSLKETPFLAEYCMEQMQKMTSTLLQYHKWTEARLNKFNTEQFKSESTAFKFTPEKELWGKRNKAYSYWM